MFRIRLLPDAEEAFKNLDKSVQSRIGEKIDWLSENAEVIVHHPLTSLPDDLRGLCRIRVGDYRIIYWLYLEEKRISVYAIEHRSKDYRSLKNK
jgi:mRNA-degrading endonuclease RelE of RelBE toxin-antitoxin system